MRNIRLIAGVVMLIMAALVLLAGFNWTINRVYVDEGQSLRLRYKGPLLFGSRKQAAEGQFAQEGEIGILEQLRGPGRHFYCPIWWERKTIDDVVVNIGEVAVVTSKLGTPLPAGEFLVDGDIEGANRAHHQGILRKVYGPGRYRVNDYGFEFKKIKTNIQKVGEPQVGIPQQLKHSGWVDIPSGYVGVRTLLADNPVQQKKAGIQDQVLPPGIYFVNPSEEQIDIVGIGYQETTIDVQKQLDAGGKLVVDESGEPISIANTGIGFPSNDAFYIQIDFTAVWGVMPEDAPNVVRTFGTIEQAEQKVVIPQSESICRNNGSRMGAVQLLVGETREEFQKAVSDEFEAVLEEKDLVLLYGLVRHIFIPQKIRVPIQNGFIADEVTLTRVQEQQTAKTEGTLREAERKVELEAQRVIVETEKMTANVMAEGQKSAKETEAETKKLVAQIDKQIAELDAKKTVLIGEAKAKASQLQQEAEAQKFELAIKAFGDPAAYNKWEFAQGLPDPIDLRFLYAGQGTLWTDLKNITPTVPLIPTAVEDRPSVKPAAKKVQTSK
jgi:regulator of protease activity HflC (stomatin/prohibitin superfamily)